MEIVKTIKRIDALNKAANRIPWQSEKHIDIWDRILDKKDFLISELKAYANSSNDRKERIRKWKNIKLAIKLLKYEYFTIIR